MQQAVITSSNTSTPVPYINGTPVLSVFTPPTLWSLQSAVDAGSYTIVDVPDPTPPAPQPDWQGFMNRLDAVELGGTGLFSAMLAIDATSAWQSYNMCLSFSRGQGGELELRTLGFIYSGLSPALTVEQQGQLTQAIADFSIPL